MEVWPEQVTLLEELGRGAFGKVHKAVLRDSPGVEVFDGKIRGTRVQFKEGRTIAVKVLSGKTISFSSLQISACTEQVNIFAKQILSLGLVYVATYNSLII